MQTFDFPIPKEAPVMVLSNALLFPRVLLPLHIFEPRYRAMLEWSLEHDRVFCVALRKPDSVETGSTDDFFHTAGLGLIRACVGAEDGTSNLMLQGLARVRFNGFSQKEPFFLANIEPLPETKSGTDELLPLAQAIRDLCRKLPEHGIPLPDNVDEFLNKLEDPSVLADSVAHAFLRDPLHRQQLLQETDVRNRLTALANHLRSEFTL